MTYPSFGFGGFARTPVYHPVHSVVTPNTGLAISVDEAKTHLGYPSGSDSDAEIEAFIRAAMASVEAYCHLTLLETVYRADLPALGLTTLLRRRPYVSVSKIEYVRASDGEIVTIGTSVYHTVEDFQHMGLVCLGSDQAWPDDDAVRKDAFRITYTAGWTPETLPYDIRNALMQIVAKMDASRGDCDSGSGNVSVYAMKNSNASPFPPVAAAMLDPYRLQELWVA